MRSQEGTKGANKMTNIKCYSIEAKGKNWCAYFTEHRKIHAQISYGVGKTQVQAVQNLIARVSK
jgi:hypothetical protein